MIARQMLGNNVTGTCMFSFDEMRNRKLHWETFDVDQSHIIQTS